MTENTISNKSSHSEFRYSISYFRPGSKEKLGISVTAQGDRKSRVMINARDLLERAFKDAREVAASETED